MISNTDSDQNELTCHVCGHINRTGTLVCANCSSLLKKNDSSNIGKTQKIGDALAKVLDNALPKPRRTEYKKGMAIHLYVEGGETGKPIVVSPSMLNKQVIIGRRDPITAQSPEIDLDEHHGYRLGVSRKHAIIELRDEGLFIIDLGSSNGTFLNGTRLPMRQPQMIMEGDNLHLGQISMTVRFARIED